MLKKDLKIQIFNKIFNSSPLFFLIPAHFILIPAKIFFKNVFFKQNKIKNTDFKKKLIPAQNI